MRRRGANKKQHVVSAVAEVAGKGGFSVFFAVGPSGLNRARANRSGRH